MARKINSFEEFHKMVPLIIRKINRDSDLALRAAANPILAFKEMGFMLNVDVEREVEQRLRFSPKERKELKPLKMQIKQLSGKDIDPLSSKSVETLLFKDLKIKKPKEIKSLDLPEPFIRNVIFSKKENKIEDALTTLKSRHVVLKPLKRFRALHLSRPGFANESLYEKLKSGQIRLPIKSIKIKLPENHNFGEEADHA
jgi:hypothetical protein